MSVDRSKAPEIRPFGHLAIPPESVDTLANGATLHHYRGGDQPVCRISAYISYDAANISNPALAKILPVMLPEGCRRHSAEELDEFFDFNGVRIACRSSARFYIIEAALLSNTAPDVLPVIAEIIDSPAFEEKRLDAARTRAVANLLTSRRQPLTLAGDELTPRIYGPGHILARRVEPEQYDAVTSQQLSAAYYRALNPANIHFFISGLFDDTLLDTARAVFGAISPRSEGEKLTVIPYSPVATPCRIETEAPESFQSAVAIGIPAIRRDNPDYVPLRLAVMALGGYFGSRLMSNIREEKGLTYHISASLLGDYEGSYAYIGALCDKSYTAQVVDEIMAELDGLASNPPQGNELERLRLNAMTDLAEILDNPTNVMEYYSSRLLVGSPADYFEIQRREIERLSPETIARMAGKYLSPERSITVTTR